MTTALAYWLGFATPLLLSAAVFLALVFTDEVRTRTQRRRQDPSARDRWPQ